MQNMELQALFARIEIKTRTASAAVTKGDAKTLGSDCRHMIPPKRLGNKSIMIFEKTTAFVHL